MNLLHDGIHEVSDLVLVKLRALKAPVVLWVGDSGMVTLEPATKSWRRSQPPPDEHMVGVYTRSARCTDIRGDLQIRMREIAQ